MLIVGKSFALPAAPQPVLARCPPGDNGKPMKCHQRTDAEVADSMKLENGIHLAVGDIVFCGDCAGVILACAIEHGKLFAIVEEMTLVRQLTNNSVVLRKSGATVVWDATSLYPAEAWYLIENQDWAALRLI